MITIISFLTFAFAIVASALPAQKRSMAQVVTKCTVPNTVALTFDDGPSHYLNVISQALLDAGAKGTFFFNGQNEDCIYSQEGSARVKYAYDRGHQIASHTWNHAHLSAIRNRTELESQFEQVIQALRKIAGVSPAFMRPPYGEYNDQVLEVASKYGQTVAIWDFDSGDSVGSSAADSKNKYDVIAKRHLSTLLALNHEIYSSTAFEVVPHAIKALQSAGYKLVTLAECLGRQPYQHIGDPAKRDKTWTC